MRSDARFIYASTPTGVMGNKGALPWYLPEDLQIFKEKTLFGSVLMGRKSFDALPASVKPLPNRTSYIVTKSRTYNPPPNAMVVRNPVEFVSKFNGTLWVIGGSEIFKLLEPYCTEVHHTLVCVTNTGDTVYHGQHIGWELVSDTGLLTSSRGVPYRTRVYKKPFSLKE